MKRTEENASGRRTRAASGTEPVEVDAQVRDRPEEAGAEAIPVPAAEEGPGRSGTRSARGTGGRTGTASGRDLDRDQVHERLAAAVSGFVDDPGKAVGEADLVADEVARALIARIEARRSELRSAWEDGADTEKLRLALRDYRTFVDEILDGRPR